MPTTRLRGDRVVVGNTGLVNGPVDDPGVRDAAIEALRRCGYLDLVDGVPLNDLAAAEQAMGRIVNERREGS